MNYLTKGQWGSKLDATCCGITDIPMNFHNTAAKILVGRGISCQISTYQYRGSKRARHQSKGIIIPPSCLLAKYYTHNTTSRCTTISTHSSIPVSWQCTTRSSHASILARPCNQPIPSCQMHRAQPRPHKSQFRPTLTRLRIQKCCTNTFLDELTHPNRRFLERLLGEQVVDWSGHPTA